MSKDNSMPRSVTHGLAVAHLDHDIANLFSEHFGSVHSTSSLADFNYSDDVPPFENLSAVTTQDVERLCAELDDNANPGPDGLPALFIKGCVPSLKVPIATLFNHSIKQGSVPQTWKKAFIFPIFKSGDRGSVSNYRPISMINTIPKLLDKAICKHLSDSLMKFIVKEQHGFCKGKSTVSNLLLFTNYIYTAFADRSQMYTVYLDFFKAFDTINHAWLLQKIRSFGVQGRLLRWLESYLSGCTQCVRVRNGLSPSITISSGIPQGSHIGPLLFILFINDLPAYLNFSKCTLYADDVKLFSRVSTPMDSSKLQRDLD